MAVWAFFTAFLEGGADDEDAFLESPAVVSDEVDPFLVPPSSSPAKITDVGDVDEA